MNTETKTVEVFVAAFGTEDEAEAALDDFQAMDREGSLDLLDGAVIVHTAEGEVHLHETADPGAKTWAAGGAIVGGLVGLIFPPSIIVSGAIGAGAGGIWSKISDRGLKDEDLKEIGESLPPGTSAIIAVAEDRMVERLEQGLAGYERIARHALNADASAELIAEIESEPETSGESKPAERPAENDEAGSGD
jgi:uncharacterized membrane protein